MPSVTPAAFGLLAYSVAVLSSSCTTGCKFAGRVCAGARPAKRRKIAADLMKPARISLFAFIIRHPCSEAHPRRKLNLARIAHGPRRFYFSSATPTQTKAAEIQRRWSTSSLRNTLAITALTMNVMEAEAGATRLSAHQENAVSRLKKPMVMQQSPSRKRPSLKTRPITASRPRRARISAKSPMRFMALESRTSPALEASTIAAMALHSSSDFMLLLRPLGMGLARAAGRQSGAAGYPTNPTTNQQDSQPAQRGNVLMQKVFSNQGDEHVPQRGGWQNIRQIGPGKGGQIGSEEGGQA